MEHISASETGGKNFVLRVGALFRIRLYNYPDLHSKASSSDAAVALLEVHSSSTSCPDILNAALALAHIDKGSVHHVNNVLWFCYSQELKHKRRFCSLSQCWIQLHVCDCYQATEEQSFTEALNQEPNMLSRRESMNSKVLNYSSWRSMNLIQVGMYI